jgi:hypothetical protein
MRHLKKPPSRIMLSKMKDLRVIGHRYSSRQPLKTSSLNLSISVLLLIFRFMEVRELKSFARHFQQSKAVLRRMMRSKYQHSMMGRLNTELNCKHRIGMSLNHTGIWSKRQSLSTSVPKLARSKSLDNEPFNKRDVQRPHNGGLRYGSDPIAEMYHLWRVWPV